MYIIKWEALQLNCLGGGKGFIFTLAFWLNISSTFVKYLMYEQGIPQVVQEFASMKHYGKKLNPCTHSSLPTKRDLEPASPLLRTFIPTDVEM